jgi:hypothetical protein
MIALVILLTLLAILAGISTGIMLALLQDRAAYKRTLDQAADRKLAVNLSEYRAFHPVEHEGPPLPEVEYLYDAAGTGLMIEPRE